MGRIHAISIGIEVSSTGTELPGDCLLPDSALGLVIFAHGSGSSRLSPRNRMVAQYLADHGIATLLFDLLTPKEAADRTNVFDIPLLADRVGDAIRWARKSPDAERLPVGLFGSSTGAAAALVAAARMPAEVAAVVSRGGRADLAAASLPRVEAPTLLIVGGADFGVIELNEAAFARLTCPRHLAIINGATHLFEEPGALEQVMELARSWFADHLAASVKG